MALISLRPIRCCDNSPAHDRQVEPQRRPSCRPSRRWIRRDIRPGADQGSSRRPRTTPVAEEERSKDRHGAANDNGCEPEAGSVGPRPERVQHRQDVHQHGGLVDPPPAAGTDAVPQVERRTEHERQGSAVRQRERLQEDVRGQDRLLPAERQCVPSRRSAMVASVSARHAARRVVSGRRGTGRFGRPARCSSDSSSAGDCGTDPPPVTERPEKGFRKIS